MNELQTFIASYGGSRLARELGVSRQAVSHWRTGRQRPSALSARHIERISGGVVRLSAIYPELFEPVEQVAA